MQKLSVKDLVTVGVFTVVYFIVFFVSAMTGFVPVMAVFYPVLIAALAGIPCVLFFTKVEHFGMVTIMSTLTGLLICLMGYGYFGIITGIIFGLIADLIMKSGDYKSFSKMVIGYAIFSIWVMGTQLPMFLSVKAYAEPFRATQGDEFVDGLEALVSWNMCAVVLLATIVAAVVGAFIGKAVLKKHFVRAGIA